MARLICSRGSFAFADAVPLLSELDFVLEPGFTGLVGENGSGKTSLLRLLAAELRLDSGQIRREPPSLQALICEQRVDHVSENARPLSRGSDGRAERLRARLELSADDLERWSTLSPGERKRWQIAGALFDEPELLLLDEPSNHLDVNGLTWLDGALRLFRGIGVLVTHDRALLDRHTHGTLRVQRGSVQAYALSYSAAQLAWQAKEESGFRSAARMALARARCSPECWAPCVSRASASCSYLRTCPSGTRSRPSSKLAPCRAASAGACAN